MIVLAFDTSSPTTTVAVVDSSAGAGPEVRQRVLAGVDGDDGRRAADSLAPAIAQVLESAAGQSAGLAVDRVDLIAVGVGPGPFTGLRVGLMTARVLGHTLGVPVVGVVSLDALALATAASDVGSGLVVATDARRREVYWAHYAAGVRVAGPSVGSPATVEVGGRAVVGRGASIYPTVLGEPVSDVLDPPAWAIAHLAVTAAVGDRLPPDPLYLRRPDAVEPTGRKRVSAP